MLDESVLESIGEVIDRLMAVPVASGSSLAARPVLIELYDAARAKFEKPLSYLAAKKITEILKPGDRVLIVTGFIVPPWLRPENDGPVGAVNLARALNLAFDVRPTIITEAMAVDMLKPLCEAGGLAVDNEKNASQLFRRVSVESFTTDGAQAEVDAEELLSRTDPKLIVTIEKASPNALGVFHSGVGYDVTNLHAKVDVLIRRAKERGIYTIGIGDGGNEIGMGCIEDTVKQVVPTGGKCGCPCGGGTASGVETDLLLAVMVSNWGATAIAANLAARLGHMEILHDREMEGKLLEAAASAGFIDPASGLGLHDGDAIDLEVHLAMVDIMNFMVKTRMTPSLYLQKYRWYVTERRDEIQDMISRWQEFVPSKSA